MYEYATHDLALLETDRIIESLEVENDYTADDLQCLFSQLRHDDASVEEAIDLIYNRSDLAKDVDSFGEKVRVREVQDVIVSYFKDN